MNQMDRLVTAAAEAATRAYAPYSHFRVGAALLCADDSIVSGVNVENRSYGLTMCAERSAILAAVSAGHRHFKALAVACLDADYPVSPCGACRQVIGEFCSGDFPVYFAGRDRKAVTTSIGALLPYDSLHELARP
jgi:cytidine deaminase